ncbi:MAG: CAP domain-containing protein, partial [Chloroflexota bacterium]
ILIKHPKLFTAARAHSKDMGCNHFVSHTSPITGNVYQRITSLNYSFSFAGENIATGYNNADDLFAGWMTSLEHKDNMLNPDFSEIGIGFASIEESDFRSYVTAVFASP